jgi:hypothetical protein
MTKIVTLAGLLILIPAIALADDTSAPVTGTTVTTEATPKAATPPRDDDQETLFGHGKIDHGGYGGPTLRFSRMLGNDAVLFGGRGGWIIDHTVIIGGGGYGLTNQILAPNRARTDFRRKEEVRVGYGGLILEYVNRWNKLVHFTAGTLIGGGAATIRYTQKEGSSNTKNEDQGSNASDSFFVLEPEVNAEINLVKFMHLDLGVSYRLITGVGGIGLENQDLRGVSGNALLRFGKF